MITNKNRLQLIGDIITLAFDRRWGTTKNFCSVSIHHDRILINTLRIAKYERTTGSTVTKDKLLLECIRVYLPDSKKYDFTFFSGEFNSDLARFYERPTEI